MPYRAYQRYKAGAIERGTLSSQSTNRRLQVGARWCQWCRWSSGGPRPPIPTGTGQRLAKLLPAQQPTPTQTESAMTDDVTPTSNSLSAILATLGWSCEHLARKLNGYSAACSLAERVHIKTPYKWINGSQPAAPWPSLIA